MLHVSYADYQSVYKGTLTDSDYGRVADEACAYIDRITYQRLEGDIPDYAKKAVCAVADVIFSKNKLLKDSKFQSRVKSFNNDGYSETYDSYSTVQRSFKKEIYDAATIYIPLSNPLRYAGVSP